MEKWKSIRGYEKFYEVSNYGRVRSLSRYVKCRGDKLKFNKGKKLKNILNNGYYIVNLMKYGQRGKFSVHRLVAEAFIKSSIYPMVMHLDDVKTNNYFLNLQYGSALHNGALAVKNGLIPRGINRPNAKLNEKKVREIRKLVTQGVKYDILCKKHHVAKTTISAVIIKQNWGGVK